MADNSRIRGFAAKEQKLQEKLDNLQSRYDNALKVVEEEGDATRSRTTGAERLLLKINEVKQQLKDLRGYVSAPTPENRPASKYRGWVNPAPGSKLKDQGPARSTPPVPEKRPSTVDTKSKKPIAKRIMEALGDKRTLNQATQDRIDNKEDEREMMGRKKGGMGQKKKAPVKKAYGGMVKKKQGGSANKVNMKAGFTRRGCSKG